MPGNIEDYVHRIGRTGRAGTEGNSISFFTDANAKMGNALIKILTEAHQTVPDSLMAYQRGGFGGGHPRYGGRGGRGGRGRGRGRGGYGGRGGFGGGYGSGANSY